MSERRTSEVKFRCTPSFKAALQSAADAAGQSLTEYIESAVWARQGAGESGLSQFLRSNVIEPRPLTREDVATYLLDPDLSEFRTLLQTDKEDSAAIVVNDDVPGCKGSCRPWEFCACKAAE